MKKQDLSLNRKQSPADSIHDPISTLLLGGISTYKAAFSPYLGARCRFVPTCSEYGREAIKKYGAGRGMWLLAKRLLKCNRLFPGGYDPVP